MLGRTIHNLHTYYNLICAWACLFVRDNDLGSGAKALLVKQYIELYEIVPANLILYETIIRLRGVVVRYYSKEDTWKHVSTIGTYYFRDLILKPVSSVSYTIITKIDKISTKPSIPKKVKI